MSSTQSALALGVLAAAPLLYAALGELLCEKLGLLNAGIEGVMLMGAVSAYIVSVNTSSIVVGLLASASVGAAFTLVFYGVPVVFMRSSQILISFAVWFIGAGLSAQLGISYTSKNLPVTLNNTHVPYLSSLPFVGPVFFVQPWPFYGGVILAVCSGILFKHTRHGLAMRAIGEDPASAHAAGIRVRAWQTVYVSVGGALMGVGGGLLSVVVAQNWKEEMTAGRGFVAFALVIFAAWRPLNLVWASYVFGLLLVLGDIGQSNGWSVPAPFLSMMPYIATLLILGGRTWFQYRRSGVSVAPSALGVTFVRGQR
jgi:simple sugar transport system permease protein